MKDPGEPFMKHLGAQDILKWGCAQKDCIVLQPSLISSVVSQAILGKGTYMCTAIYNSPSYPSTTSAWKLGGKSGGHIIVWNPLSSGRYSCVEMAYAPNLKHKP